MQNQPIKPLKRDIHLLHLSHEHHNGLMIVFRIRKGIKNKTGFERIRDYILHCWNEDLLPHFNEEEAYVFNLPSSKELEAVITAKQQHLMIAELIEKLRKNEDVTEQFANLLDEHIRFEERTVFELIQTLPEAELDTLPIRKAVECIIWADEFWKKEA